ncbi:MAG TPA: sulfatase-like hydrolase/transferase [Acidimicrobiia bacterium]|nr:sulfatase-like hydrolase/transferase [Acidimicrobiia bacterium]
MPGSSRPNLLLFMTDQQRADSVGALGNAAARTPNLDALAARGTRFTQAFSQHSACAQSRIAMMTGWYPHVAGHRTLDNLLKPWEPNVLATLRAAGYHVAWPGVRGDTFAPGVTASSTDFFGYLVAPSLDVWAASHREVFPPGHPMRHAHYTGRLETGGPSPDEAAVQTAIALLEDGVPEPFVLFVTLFAPHPPFAVEEPWFSLHDRADMPAPGPPGQGKPGFMGALRDASGLDRLTDADWAELAATYYGMVSRVDDQLGRLLVALDRAGVADRTVTFTYTDHGEYLGDFGLVEKWPSGLDDCLLRNPLLVAGPGVAEGAVHDGLVEMIDLVPTLCELAETEVGHVQFGRSLVPALRGHAERARRDVAFSEGGFRVDEETQNELRAEYPYDVKTAVVHDRPELVGRAIAMRTDDWTYVYRTCEDDELYDRRADPGERVNVAGTAANGETVRALRDRVLHWLVETSDVIPLARDPRLEPALLDEMLSARRSR